MVPHALSEGLDEKILSGSSYLCKAQEPESEALQATGPFVTWMRLSSRRESTGEVGSQGTLLLRNGQSDSVLVASGECSVR